MSLVFSSVWKTVILVFTGVLLPSERPVLAFTVIRVITEDRIVCGYRIMAITSAFQADDAGSIPATRSSSRRYQVVLGTDILYVGCFPESLSTSCSVIRDIGYSPVLSFYNSVMVHYRWRFCIS